MVKRPVNNEDNPGSSFKEEEFHSKKYPDSIDYWVNEDYLKQLNSGKDVCVCLSDNPFPLLYIDSTFQTILIQSSTHHFGLETTVELDLIKNDSLNKSFYVEKQWPLSDILKLKINNSVLLVAYNQKIYKFRKTKLKALNIPTTSKGIFTYSFDIWMQRNRLNAISLLSYSRTDADSSSQLLTYLEITALIDSNKIFVGCSDDYHINSLRIKGETNRYFDIFYKDSSIIMYEEPEGGRSRYEKLDYERLRKQTFYKEK